MDGKRPYNETAETPEKREPKVPRLDQDEDFIHWDVEDTCCYLRNEGLGEWETIFKGECSVFTQA